MTKEQRTTRTRYAVQAYAGVVGFAPADHVPDLICDLLHYARENGLEVDATLRSAVSNYVAERLGPDESLGPHVETRVTFI